MQNVDNGGVYHLQDKATLDFQRQDEKYLIAQMTCPLSTRPHQIHLQVLKLTSVASLQTPFLGKLTRTLKRVFIQSYLIVHLGLCYTRRHLSKLYCMPKINFLVSDSQSLNQDKCVDTDFLIASQGSLLSQLWWSQRTPQMLRT